jgi:hypothetical protein
MGERNSYKDYQVCHVVGAPGSSAYFCTRNIERVTIEFGIFAYFVCGNGEVSGGFRWGDLRDRNHLEDLNVEDRVILKRILKYKLTKYTFYKLIFYF